MAQGDPKAKDWAEVQKNKTKQKNETATGRKLEQ